MRRLYVSPTEDCITPLINVVKNAKRSLRVAFFTFNIPDLTDAIIERHNAGVDVECLFDASQTASFTAMALQIARLKAAGVLTTVGTSPKHRYMHFKLVVADRVVVFGSFNATKGSQQESNTLYIETSTVLSTKLAQEFDIVIAWNAEHPKVWYEEV